MTKETFENDYVTGKHGWHLPPSWDYLCEDWVTGDKSFIDEVLPYLLH